MLEEPRSSGSHNSVSKPQQEARHLQSRLSCCRMRPARRVGYCGCECEGGKGEGEVEEYCEEVHSYQRRIRRREVGGEEGIVALEEGVDFSVSKEAGILG
jgi:hypothetical protein